MTLESPPFCPHCGEPLSPNVGYCPGCGKDVFAEPVSAGPPETTADDAVEIVEIVEVVEIEPAPEVARGRLRTALVAVGIVAVVAIGGTAWTMFRGQGTDDGYWSERLAQPAAVASVPALAWTWEAGEEVQQILTEGPTTYVVTEGGVTALDAEGAATWTTDLPEGSDVRVTPGQPDHLLAVSFDRGLLLALDADDGSELWTAASDGYVDTVRGHVIMRFDEVVRALDARTGREQWTAAASEGIGVGPDAVYVADDDHLRRLDIDTGGEDWSRRLDPASAPTESDGITVAEGFVVAAGTDTVTAFDSDNGAERWAVDIDRPTDARGASATGLVTRSTVYVWGADRDRAPVYDEHGPAGSLPIDEADWFYAFPIHGADGDYVISGDEGVVYDDELERVGMVSPNVAALSGEGLYDVAEPRLSFTPFGAIDPAWEADLGIGPSDRVSAGDGHVVVASGRTVSDYR